MFKMVHAMKYIDSDYLDKMNDAHSSNFMGWFVLIIAIDAINLSNLTDKIEV